MWFSVGFFSHLTSIFRQSGRWIQLSSLVLLRRWVEWVMCACTDLFKERARGMPHMHVYEECSVSGWIVFWWRGTFWDRCSALWDLTHWLPSASRRVCVARPTDPTLEIYRMAPRWISARSHTEQYLPSPPFLFINGLTLFFLLCTTSLSHWVYLFFFFSFLQALVAFPWSIPDHVRSLCPTLPFVKNYSIHVSVITFIHLLC